MSALFQYIVRIHYPDSSTEDVYVNAHNKKEAFYLGSIHASRPEMIENIVIVKERKIGDKN